MQVFIPNLNIVPAGLCFEGKVESGLHLRKKGFVRGRLRSASKKRIETSPAASTLIVETHSTSGFGTRPGNLLKKGQNTWHSQFRQM
jgi:hypothetical protein